MGFMADPRRGNVALSRAKFGVFLFGNKATLESSNSFWKDLLGVLEKDGRLFEKCDLEFLTSENQLKSSSKYNYIWQKMVGEVFRDIITHKRANSNVVCLGDDSGQKSSSKFRKSRVELFPNYKKSANLFSKG